MQRLLRSSLLAAFCAASLATSVLAADTPAGFVDFGKFLPPAGKGEFVEVNIKENLLSFAATIAKRHEPEAAALLNDLKSIRVNVVGLDDQNRADLTARVAKIRGDLEAQGWERTVVAKQNDDDVAVYVRTGKGHAIEGVVVTVLEGTKNAVFVNIVGNIDPEKIAVLGEKFGIDPLKKLHPVHAEAQPEKPAAS